LPPTFNWRFAKANRRELTGGQLQAEETACHSGPVEILTLQEAEYER
jgi:hypothetical protein